jgi:2-polyprenyl-6-methoxyphenol hydroxylase-like FAD-dependent oxidoreductase
MRYRETTFDGDRTSSPDIRVAIAGGGIGGLALALSLNDAGFREVDVSESAWS